MVSMRPNYFIFMGYLKTGAGRGVQANLLNPLWIRHWIIAKADANVIITCLLHQHAFALCALQKYLT